MSTVGKMAHSQCGNAVCQTKQASVSFLTHVKLSHYLNLSLILKCKCSERV